MPTNAQQMRDPATELSETIVSAMEAKNLSIRGLAEKIRLTYEHARRIVRGESVPSTLALQAICNALDINFDDVERLAVAANIRAKYGDIPAEIAGKNPELEPVERAWPKLTPAQKRDAIAMIQGWAKSNKIVGV